MDFRECSQCEMPDDQTVSHYQSIFDQKNHLNFSALVESKIAGIVFKGGGGGVTGSWKREFGKKL